MIDLKDIHNAHDCLGLSKKMKEKLAAIGEVTTASAGEYLFREGDPAVYYYILNEGKVLLEFAEPDGSVNMEEVTAGLGIGCSSLAGLKNYSSHARCEKPSKLLRWTQKDLRHLFNEDGRLGYLLIKAMAKLLTKRVTVKSHKLYRLMAA